MRIARLLVFVFWLFLIGTYIPSKSVTDVFDEPFDPVPQLQRWAIQMSMTNKIIDSTHKTKVRYIKLISVSIRCSPSSHRSKKLMTDRKFILSYFFYVISQVLLLFFASECR